MRCTLCGAQTHPGHVYCPRCAHEIAQRQTTAPRQRRSPWKSAGLAGVVLCALAGAAFEAKKIVAPFLSRAGLATTNQLLNAQAKQLDATLRATTKAPDKDLTVATSPGVDSVVGSEAPQPQRVMTSVVQPPNAPVLGDSAVATGLPAEVRAWVDHLCQIESERQRLTKSQVSRATSLLGGLQGSEFHAASDEDSSTNRMCSFADCLRSNTQGNGKHGRRNTKCNSIFRLGPTRRTQFSKPDAGEERRPCGRAGQGCGHAPRGTLLPLRGR